MLLLKTGIAVLLICKTFYNTVYALPPMMIVGYFYYRSERRKLSDKKKQETREQFKELLLLVSTRQRAGYSVENALIDSIPDMRFLYGENSGIYRILTLLQNGFRNHIPLENIWTEAGGELHLPEINDFAKIYELSYKRSGNMTEIMDRTALAIIEKEELEKEIYLNLCAREYEMKIMSIMPFAMILYVSVSSPGYFDEMYKNPLGIVFMSIALTIYIFSYVLATKIVHIENQE